MLRLLGLTTVTALSMLAFSTVMATPRTAMGDDRGDEKAPVTAKTAFAKLKSLAGTWNNKISSAEHHEPASDSKVNYRLTGAGSALVQTDFPNSNHEMVSVYHLDGDDLRMTHYCAMGNQPRLKLDRASSTPTRLVFVFDGGSNLDAAKDMHIHGLTINFEKQGEVDAAWVGYAAGKKAGTTHFHLTPEKR